MEREFQERFLKKWDRYFPGAELPIGFYYSPVCEPRGLAPIPKGHRCVIGDLAKVRKGKTLSFSNETIGCGGGKRYLGFTSHMAPRFEYFLSCGIPGKLEGERYKKSPEIVKAHLKSQPVVKAPAEYLVFKRWDKWVATDQPAVVIFFASSDVLSGLFTLANYEERQPQGVIAPFCAGCASIVDIPYRELKNPTPRAVLGMFDVSARPCVSASHLSFAVPWPKFVRMVEDMDESFLITKSWGKVRRRISRIPGQGRETCRARVLGSP